MGVQKENTPIMKRILLILIAFITTGIAEVQAQTKNIVYDANAEVRKVTGFKAVEVSGAIDLYISQGTEEAVAISASSDEARGRIKTEVTNGTLHIYFEGKGWNWKSWTNTKMKAYVTFTTLSRVEASGACNVMTTDPIKVGDFKIDFSGASDFKGDVNADNVTIISSGASNIRLAGTADKATIEASGACTIKAYDFKINMCKADASGASNIRITVNKELKADASGGSTIYYKGDGIIRDIDTSGGASVKKKSDND